MTQALRPSTLVPRGFVVEDAASEDSLTLITVRSLRSVSACPGCGMRSERIHSRYRRRLADLPMAGKPVRLVVVARRFHCDAVLCGADSDGNRHRFRELTASDSDLKSPPISK